MHTVCSSMCLSKNKDGGPLSITLPDTPREPTYFHGTREHKKRHFAQRAQHDTARSASHIIALWKQNTDEYTSSKKPSIALGVAVATPLYPTPPTPRSSSLSAVGGRLLSEQKRVECVDSAPSLSPDSSVPYAERSCTTTA